MQAVLNVNFRPAFLKLALPPLFLSLSGDHKTLTWREPIEQKNGCKRGQNSALSRPTTWAGPQQSPQQQVAHNMQTIGMFTWPDEASHCV